MPEKFPIPGKILPGFFSDYFFGKETNCDWWLMRTSTESFTQITQISQMKQIVTVG
ncbi:MAG TPA: hypothetical protein PK515_04585 [Candidatus Cloacimonas sp.]|nr:hypothetical protein [Candidatus Cloacimonas sp.]